MNHSRMITYSIISLAVAIFFVLGTTAIAQNYAGLQTPISIKPVGSTGPYFPATLAWYSDAPDKYCTDSDGGFNPLAPGYILFTDPSGASNMVAESCAGNAVSEMVCVKNANVKETNGSQKHNYALVTLVKCSDVGKTTCKMTTQGFPMGYCSN